MEIPNLWLEQVWDSREISGRGDRDRGSYEVDTSQVDRCVYSQDSTRDIPVCRTTMGELQEKGLSSLKDDNTRQ